MSHQNVVQWVFVWVGHITLRPPDTRGKVLVDGKRTTPGGVAGSKSAGIAYDGLAKFPWLGLFSHVNTADTIFTIKVLYIT